MPALRFFFGVFDQVVVVVFFEFADGFGELLVFFHQLGDFGLPGVTGGAHGGDVHRDAEELGQAAGDGFDGERVHALEVAGDLGDDGEHFEAAGRGLGEEEGRKAGGAFVVGEADGVLLEGGLEVGVGDGAEHAGFAGVGDGAAEGADENDAFSAEGLGHGKDAVGEGLPAEVGFAADEEGEVGGGVGVEVGGGEVEGAVGEAVDVFDHGSEHGGDFHGAGEVEDVEGVGVNGGQGDDGAVFHEAFDGAGGHQAAIHPAGEGEEEGGAGEGEGGGEFEFGRIQGGMI